MNDWDKKLQRADRHEGKWKDRSKKVLKCYRDDDRNFKSTGSPKMNLLWSNTETLRPAMYSQTPVPVVARRFNQDDPIARSAAEVLERTISFSIDSGLGDFDLFAHKVITDYLLVGRSVDRVLYEPLEKDEQIVFEQVKYHKVPWDCFRYDPQERWEDVRWIAYGDHYYTWDELKERYALKESDKALYSPTKKDSDDKDYECYQVWEIWDKDSEKVIHYIEGSDEPIEENDPPVRVRGFFDCPEPLYSFKTNDSLIPIPEYTLYQYQADEVNRLTERIQGITKAIRATFAYAGDQKGLLDELLKADDGTGIPVSNWTAIVEKGGIEGLMAYAPVEQYVKTLQILVAQRQQLVQQIFEITGIADIMRGATDARETARAQTIKANFGNRRLLPRQRDVQRYFRDLFRIAGEIIVESFSRSTLEDIVGKPIEDQVLTILRNDSDRAFRVDIETDSTIAPDEMQQKQDIAEFMSAMASFLPAAQGIAAQGGLQVVGSLMLWAIRRFRAGREVEEIIEGMMRNPPPPQPDPEAQKMQAEMQMEQQKNQQEAQIKQQEAQLRMAEMQQEIEIEKQKAQIEIQKMIQEMRIEMQMNTQKLEQMQAEGQIRVMSTIAQGQAKAEAARMQPRATNGD